MQVSPREVDGRVHQRAASRHFPNRENTAVDNMSPFLRYDAHSSRLLTSSVNLLTLHARFKLQREYQLGTFGIRTIRRRIRYANATGLYELATLHQNGSPSHVA